MASTYSTNLAIELIGTGDQAGTWGNTTNTNLGTLIEQAISGYVTQAVSTGTDTTITIPNGATGVARNMYIELTGTGGTNTNLIVPSNKKLYFIFNNTSSGQVTVKVSGQTGVSVPQGKKVVLTSNGTDVVNGLNYIADFGSNSATITQLTATSATITNLTLTSLVISNLSIASANITTLTSASATITNLINTSASITTLTNNPTFSAGTANGVLYLNASKVATSGSALTFDGSKLTVTDGTRAGVIAPRAASAGGLAAGTDVASTGYVLNLAGDLNGGGTGGGVNIAYYSSSSATWNAGLSIRNTASTYSNLLLMADGGNVGIGTSSPAYKLDVNTGAAGVLQRWNTNAVSMLVEADHLGNGNWYLSPQGSQSFNVKTGGSTRLTLDSSGNLGIGTSSPAYKLDVSGTFRVAGASNFIVDSFGAVQAPAGVYVNTTGTRAAGINSSGADLGFRTGNTDNRMLLDSSGNLGLGVTPSAWNALIKGFEIGRVGNGIWGQTNNQVMSVVSNAYYGSDWKYANNGVASAYQMDSSGKHVWSIAASGTAGNAISFTQAMTLDASGRLLISAGASAPNDASGFWLTNQTGVGPTLSGLNITFQTGSTGAQSERARITSAGYFKASNSGNYTNATGAYHEFYQTGGSAVCYFRATDANYTGTVIEGSGDRATTNTSYYLIDVYNGNLSGRFRVTDAGNCQNTNSSYGGTSDIKLKQDIVDAASQWDDIKSLRVRKYRFKDNPESALQIGVVAQEIEAVSPGLVEESIDRDKDGNDLGTTTKSVKYSVLYMKAVKALQEAMARIEQLETKVAALESK